MAIISEKPHPSDPTWPGRLAHEVIGGAKEQRRLVEIVSPTSQLNIRGGGHASLGEWLDMVEFEQAGFTAPAGRADEGAPALIALPHCTSDRRRNVPGAADRRRGLPRRRRYSAAAPLEVSEQQGQRTVEESGDVAIRMGVPEEILRATQLAVGLLRDGHLQLVAIG